MIKEEQNKKSIHSSSFDDKLPENTKEIVIAVQFHLAQNNWPFINFVQMFSTAVPFLIIEQAIKSYHGCVKNLQIFSQQLFKKKIDYEFRDSLDSKLHLFKLIPGSKQPRIKLYYRYDNGYEWPLLYS